MFAANHDIREWFCTPGARDAIHTPHPATATIARGAFGQVSVAIHTANDGRPWRFLAVKSIALPNRQWGSPPEEPEPLPIEVVHEISALRLLNPHPNIVQLRAVYPTKEGVALAFGYCPVDLHRTLEWRRRRSLPLLSIPTIRGIAHDLFSALRHCHSRGCLHLDIKPGNLLVSSLGVVQLCDFGLAQPHQPSDNTSSSPDDQDLPQPKGLCTLYYRPPELLLGSHRVSPAGDMYSAGLVCCELVAGFPIFRGENGLGQLAETFDILGTPQVDTWPAVVQLPDYGKLQFAHKAARPLETVLPRAKESPSLLRLLQQLVVLDPSKRPSAEAVLAQPWFQDCKLDRLEMQVELIPEELQEPILLSNLNKDFSIASQKALDMAAVQRGFLKSLHSWKGPDTAEIPSLQTKCYRMCPRMTHDETEKGTD